MITGPLAAHGYAGATAFSGGSSSFIASLIIQVHSTTVIRVLTVTIPLMRGCSMTALKTEELDEQNDAEGGTLFLQESSKV